MILKSASKILVTLLLIFNLSTSVSIAGSPVSELLNEQASDILVSYFDLRQRSTQVQVTNISSIDTATIHVQIFSDAFECEDRDFTDTLTPNETHVYDISNLVSANGNPINFAIPDGSHGFVLISSAVNNAPQMTIIGNFRIIDVAGYEYRVNSAAREDFFGPDESTSDRVGRFTQAWGANQADIVGVDVDDQDDPPLPDGTLDLSVDIANDGFELFVFDDEETGTSCGEVFFGCDERPGGDGEPAVFTDEFINQGINDVFPNSRGGSVLCPGDFNTEGYVSIRGVGEDLRLVAFSGLNDGVSRGSMDRFKYINFVLMGSGGV